MNNCGFWTPRKIGAAIILTLASGILVITYIRTRPDYSALDPNSVQVPIIKIDEELNVNFNRPFACVEVDQQENTRQENVIRAYNSALNRIPKPDEVEAVLADPSSWDMFYTALLQSPEFEKKYGKVDNRSLVEIIFKNALQREPDAQEYTVWQPWIESHGRLEFFKSITNSEEARHILTPDKIKTIKQIWPHAYVRIRRADSNHIVWWINTPDKRLSSQYVELETNPGNTTCGYVDSPQ
jgi:hypothetical protein